MICCVRSHDLGCESCNDTACIVFDVQQQVDGLIEQEKAEARSVTIDCGFQYSCYGCCSIGTTKKGIGPAYSAKVGCAVTDTLNYEPRLLLQAGRVGLRVCDLYSDPAVFRAK